MIRYVAALVILCALYGFAPDAEAACSTQSVQQSGVSIQYTGDCTEDNEVLFTTGDMTTYKACMLMSTTGVVDVVLSLDSTNYSTAPLSIYDLGATDNNPVLVTVALRIYAFPLAGARRVRVLQNGATDAAATLTCS